MIHKTICLLVFWLSACLRMELTEPLDIHSPEGTLGNLGVLPEWSAQILVEGPGTLTSDPGGLSGDQTSNARSQSGAAYVFERSDGVPNPTTSAGACRSTATKSQQASPWQTPTSIRAPPHRAPSMYFNELARKIQVYFLNIATVLDPLYLEVMYIVF